jgi:hypothetical protein
MKDVIAIRWDSTTEYIEIDFDKLAKHPAITSTSEWWDDEKIRVVYNTTSKAKKRPRGHVVITIAYDRKLNRSPVLAKGGARWGTSTITLRPPYRTGTAVWRDEVPKSGFDGTRRWKRATGGLFKRRKSILRAVATIERRQAEFRNLLIGVYSECAISGERCPGVLEAAHIIPSRLAGAESLENGVLLRADLHRLYDSGGFTIDAAGKFRLARHGGFSDAYRELIEGARLPSSVFQRVRKALARKLANRLRRG